MSGGDRGVWWRAEGSGGGKRGLVEDRGVWRGREGSGWEQRGFRGEQMGLVVDRGVWWWTEGSRGGQRGQTNLLM